eukprot:CAMPEP_0176268412 /NCGR_PEP_ID=MMETSP0121_2-20121125/43660_1 /TAXON_ID=160619 /ORGANISM="Kryptoperidinium foliaceum, Strain CCMP 1326" /LENGTH=184 /DNA_ID=CAMNT_0017608503 /DNA_START=129 /DNA_END=679 /DNA_ORIENTATION=+
MHGDAGEALEADVGLLCERLRGPGGPRRAWRSARRRRRGACWEALAAVHPQAAVPHERRDGWWHGAPAGAELGAGRRGAATEVAAAQRLGAGLAGGAAIAAGGRPGIADRRLFARRAAALGRGAAMRLQLAAGASAAASTDRRPDAEGQASSERGGRAASVSVRGVAQRPPRANNALATLAPPP